MAKQAVEDAVRARLVANFTATTILTSNQDVLPPAAGSSWVRVEFPVANSSPTSYASSDAEIGSFRIVVGSEMLSGPDQSLGYCETIAAIFARQRFSGITCFTPSVSDGRDDGIFFMRSVIVPYRYDYAA